jgi:eukaryotic-like serine/threonine-protein kinase
LAEKESIEEPIRQEYTQAILPPTTPQDSLKKNDKYRISSLIAQGGMASVFVAKDSNCRREVALKVMQNADTQKKEIVNRFIEEAQIAAQLDHPNILPIYDLTTDGQGNPFYAMKLVKGDTLETLISKLKDKNPETLKEYPLSRLLQLFIKICDGMSFAANRNVVHRDLKPENIMIGPFGEVFIMDWGIAKVIDSKKSRHQTSANPQDSIDRLSKDDTFNIQTTMQGQILGTPGFMAPEQVINSSQADIHADIYALGSIFYNILCLVPPHSEIDIKTLMKNKISGNIPSPEQRVNAANIDLIHLPGKQIPPSLSAVCQKAMALNSCERYNTPKELEKDIQAYLDGYATQAEGANQLRLFQLLFLRHKRLSFSLLILFGLTISFLIMSTFKLKYAENESESASSYATLTEKQISQSMHTLNNLRTTMRELRTLTPEIEDQVERLIQHNRFARALEISSAYLKLEGSETLYVQNIQILIRLSKPKKAQKNLAEALQEFPESQKLQELRIILGL